MRVLILIGLAIPLFGLGCTWSYDDDAASHGDDDAGDDDAGDDDAGDDDDDAGDDDDDAGDDDAGDDDFPEFFSANDDFFELHIGPIPQLDPATFTLSVTGLVDQPATFTLAELEALPVEQIPLTVECIGNSVGGHAVDTAMWEGFALSDLLDQVGVLPSAVAVRYLAEDGYHVAHSLEQVELDGVIGVLRMNGEDLPARHGAPLRFVLPYTYGVKHPGWVTEIQLVSQQPLDYWELVGWDCSPQQHVDSKIFFPAGSEELPAGVPFEVGGAAWSAGRITGVEVTTDEGQTWLDASIVQEIEADGVWVFWSATLTVDEPGVVEIHSRATDSYGHVQPQEDLTYQDGTNSWPRRQVQIVEG